MSKMVKVQLKVNALQLLSKSYRLAVIETAHVLMQEVMYEEVIPYKTGTLQNSMYVDTSSSFRGLIKIVHDTPYATRLYFHPEYNFNQELNANAQGLWWESKLRSSEPMDIFLRVYKRRVGGYVK